MAMKSSEVVWLAKALLPGSQLGKNPRKGARARVKVRIVDERGEGRRGC